MPLNLEGRVALVTGATSGIGLALARALRAAGATVVATGRDQGRLASLAPEVSLALTCDLTRAADIELVRGVLEDRFERLDLLVNNAGVGLFQGCEETSMEDLEGVLRVNLLGPVALTRALLPLMRASASPGPGPRGHGMVVNVASVAARRAFPLHGAYCASKFGLLGWSQVLAQELGPEEPAVLVVCPPAVDTPFFQRAGWPDFLRDHPGLRLMSPEAVARETLSAVARGERLRVLSARARLLDRVSLLAPGLLWSLRELRSRLRPSAPEDDPTRRSHPRCAGRA